MTRENFSRRKKKESTRKKEGKQESKKQSNMIPGSQAPPQTQNIISKLKEK